MNKERPDTPRRVIIAGGGTAGWMMAAAMAKTMGHVIDLSLIESDMIGTIGVGEATIPPLIQFNQSLDINEAEFMKATKATFKLGINFESWREKGQDYFHSFGFTGKDHWTSGFQHFWLRSLQEGQARPYGEYCMEVMAAEMSKFAHLPGATLNYAYHLDASLYAGFLRKLAEDNGTRRIEGKIRNVNLHGETGYIESLTLESGQTIAGDLFIDCTGFRALLAGDALHTGYDDWSHYLPCDRAIAIPTRSVDPTVPYTRSIAHDAGWQWRIPLQHRTGNGLVYCSRYMDQEQALQILLDNIEGEAMAEPNFIRFQTGMRRRQWVRNCIVTGLSGGFMEPLESTSIHLIQKSIVRLMRMMPYAEINPHDIDEFNDQTEQDMLQIRDFLILHYHVTNRRDTPFWRHCASMNIPDSLRHRIDLFQETARVFRRNEELFAENSWVQVMMGQGITPQAYHPIADKMGDDELKIFLSTIRDHITKTIKGLPAHDTYVRQLCGASES